MARGFIFFINSIAALASILYYIIADIPPSKQLVLNGFSLLFPLLLVSHFIFISFWLIKLDKRGLLSLFIVLIGYKYSSRFIVFNTNQEGSKTTKIKIASYNVSNFKKQIINSNKSTDNIFNLLDSLKVMVLGLQEAHYRKQNVFLKSNFKKDVASQSWIYSNRKIINFDILDILSSDNKKDLSFIDVLIDKDTLRIYNLHFQSYKFSKTPKELKQKGFTKNIRKTRKGFLVHEKEVNSLIKHIKTSPYPAIVMGDFNNNAFSYEYNRLLKECNLKDTFVEAGSGFGATFDFSYFPTRIDFILVPKTAKVHSHQILTLKDWSDHYPVISEISL